VRRGALLALYQPLCPLLRPPNVFIYSSRVCSLLLPFLLSPLAFLSVGAFPSVFPSISPFFSYSSFSALPSLPPLLLLSSSFWYAHGYLAGRRQGERKHLFSLAHPPLPSSLTHALFLPYRCSQSIEGTQKSLSLVASSRLYLLAYSLPSFHLLLLPITYPSLPPSSHHPRPNAGGPPAKSLSRLTNLKVANGTRHKIHSYHLPFPPSLLPFPPPTTTKRGRSTSKCLSRRSNLKVTNGPRHKTHSPSASQKRTHIT